MQNGHLVAQFMTEHSGAKDMLEQQMNQLRAALQSQGLQVEKLEVTQNNTPSIHNGVKKDANLVLEVASREDAPKKVVRKLMMPFLPQS